MGLDEQLRALVAAGRAPLSALDADAEELRELGFVVDADVVRVPDVERLNSEVIRGQLGQSARAWLQALNVYSVVGSTSTLLMEATATGAVAGTVNMAELQLAGRGRRGRRWVSPFGRNLAISLGLFLPLAPAQLGGYSLSVGLAILDLLERTGVRGVGLKWPNDVLLDGRKLAGILVELVARPDGTEVIVGVGVNLDLPEEVLSRLDQPVADLAHRGVAYSRNTLAAALVSNLVDYAAGFADHGFAPMRSEFDRHHYFHARDCRILQGDLETAGVVRGVTEEGELLLDTETGLQTFSAGEVSLRESATWG